MRSINENINNRSKSAEMMTDEEMKELVWG